MAFFIATQYFVFRSTSAGKFDTYTDFLLFPLPCRKNPFHIILNQRYWLLVDCRRQEYCIRKIKMKEHGAGIKVLKTILYNYSFLYFQLIKECGRGRAAVLTQNEENVP